MKYSFILVFLILKPQCEYIHEVLMLVWRASSIKQIHNSAKHRHFIHINFHSILPVAQRIVESLFYFERLN